MALKLLVHRVIVVEAQKIMTGTQVLAILHMVTSVKDGSFYYKEILSQHLPSTTELLI